MQEKTPKAHWDASSTIILCEICKDKKDAGNRPTAFLSPEGYKCLARDFGRRTGKNYSKIQLKKQMGFNKNIVPSMGVLQNQSYLTWLGSSEANNYSR